jgi:taurine dioxygenase
MQTSQENSPGSEIFSIRPVKSFGVEIDFDLRQPLTQPQQEELKRLHLAHQLLLFRNQSLTLNEQERVMGHLGPILTDVIDRMDYVSTDTSIGSFGTGIITFHSDLAFTPSPFPSISLHAKNVEERATATSFASAVHAYKAMPQALRDRLRDMQIFNCIASDNEGRARDQEIPEGSPNAVRPMVWRHPETGEELILVNYQQTICVNDLPEEESEALLFELFSYLYAPSNVYEHRWCNGDLIIWDNIALQHARPERVTGTRTLQRVTGGQKGVIAMYPHMRAIYESYVAKNLARYESKTAST